MGAQMVYKQIEVPFHLCTICTICAHIFDQRTSILLFVYHLCTRYSHSHSHSQQGRRWDCQCGCGLYSLHKWCTHRSGILCVLHLCIICAMALLFVHHLCADYSHITTATASASGGGAVAICGCGCTWCTNGAQVEVPWHKWCTNSRALDYKTTMLPRVGI